MITNVINSHIFICKCWFHSHISSKSKRLLSVVRNNLSSFMENYVSHNGLSCLQIGGGFEHHICYMIILLQVSRP